MPASAKTLGSPAQLPTIPKVKKSAESCPGAPGYAAAAGGSKTPGRERKKTPSSPQKDVKPVILPDGTVFSPSKAKKPSNADKETESSTEEEVLVIDRDEQLQGEDLQTCLDDHSILNVDPEDFEGAVNAGQDVTAGVHTQNPESGTPQPDKAPGNGEENDDDDKMDTSTANNDNSGGGRGSFSNV